MTASAQTPFNIGIYIYQDAEVLDFSGPFEVFSTASRLTDTPVFNVFLVAQDLSPVRARGGYSINPDYTIHKHPAIDVLLIPGGVHTHELNKPDVIHWVQTTSTSAAYVTSVCTGAFILAKAGLLAGLNVTTHWEDIDDLRSSFSELNVIEGVRWVDEGKYVTSAGISAGIDMSLHLVAKIIDSQLAVRTAKQMDFEWRKNPSS